VDIGKSHTPAPSLQRSRKESLSTHELNIIKQIFKKNFHEIFFSLFGLDTTNNTDKLRALYSYVSKYELPSLGREKEIHDLSCVDGKLLNKSALGKKISNLTLEDSRLLLEELLLKKSPQERTLFFTKIYKTFPVNKYTTKPSSSPPAIGWNIESDDLLFRVVYRHPETKTKSPFVAAALELFEGEVNSELEACEVRYYTLMRVGFSLKEG
jgi:hypothetical protein